MLEIAEQIQAWQRAGRSVAIVRLVETEGFSSRERDHILALTPGEPVAGSVLGGALDAPVLAAVDPDDEQRSILELSVSDAGASAAGLSCGGTARLLVHPASDIGAAGWRALTSGEPVCLVTGLEPSVGPTEVFTAATIEAAETRYGPGVRRVFNRGATETRLLTAPSRVVTALWPVPSLVVVGGGVIAEALSSAATLLGWTSAIVTDATAARAAVADLTHADALVVISHDRGVDGPALEAALASRAGYIGALGSARTQAARSSWLCDHDVPAGAIGRIRGPAGLDIGANTPAEIAVAIAAEILAVRSATGGGPLQGRLGPIRPD